MNERIINLVAVAMGMIWDEGVIQIPEPGEDGLEQYFIILPRPEFKQNISAPMPIRRDWS